MRSKWQKIINGAMLSVLLLTACERGSVNIETKPNLVTDASPSDTLKAVDQSLANAGKITKPDEIKFTLLDFEYSLPKTVRDICQSADNCPQIEVKLVRLKPAWVEQILNRAITQDDNPQRLKFKQKLDDFAFSQLSNPSSHTYTLTLTPKMIASHQQLAQFAVEGYIDTGGAHGMPSLNYYIFDMQLQSQISLDDLLLGGKKDDLKKLAYQAFLDYLDTNLGIDNAQELDDYQATWTFVLSDNFYFDQTGLVLVYQPYQIGAYTQGFVELAIAYDKLDGVVRATYLPNQS